MFDTLDWHLGNSWKEAATAVDDARRTPHAAFVFSILMVCNRPILTSDYLKGDCVPFFDNINNHDHKKNKKF